MFGTSNPDLQPSDRACLAVDGIAGAQLWESRGEIEDFPPLALILGILSALLSTLYEAECFTPVDMEGSPVSDQPSVKAEVGGTNTESVSSHFFLARTTVTRAKFPSPWECMINFAGKFSLEHRMPTLLSMISVSCFDILDSMSGRGEAIISLGSRASLN